VTWDRGATEPRTIAGLRVATHDGVDLLADAYLPAADGPRPAMVLLHGGAFTKGSRASYARWGRFLAANGYVGLATDYRLATADQATYPQAIFDAKAAVQYLRASSGELGVDPDRIGVMGGSAGAYLAAMVALTARLPAFANPYDDGFAGVSAAVDVVVPMAGSFDMLARWEFDRTNRPAGERTAEAFIGGTPFTERARWYEASPLFHASEQNATGTKWLFAWGTEDDVTPAADHSLRLATALKQAGALVRLVPLVGAPHYWYMEGEVGPSNPFAELMGMRLLTFLETWSGWGPRPASG
jgi:acetyl esterase/lipase